MKKTLLVLMMMFSIVFTYSCTDTTTEDAHKIEIAVSIVPQATFVAAVAGNLVDIVTVIPPGFSPGNYEPSSQTMENLSDASIYFAIGVAAEDASILPSLSEVRIVHLDEAVSQVYPDRMFSANSRDPHIWLSVKRVIIMVQVIADELSTLDFAHAETYQENADAYVLQLENINILLETAFGAMTMNKFIVFHPAYGYFAEEYGLEMISIEEDGKEATASHLGDVIDMAIAFDIHTVFYQAEIDSSQVEAFAEEIDAEMVMLDPLAIDYLNNIVQMANLILGALS
jgi:zinc transport system substrate-binding protein